MKRRHFLQLAGAAIVAPKLLSSTKNSNELRVVLIDERLKPICFGTKSKRIVEKYATKTEWLVDEKRSLFWVQIYDTKNRLVYKELINTSLYSGDTFTVIIPEKIRREWKLK